jgi:hypothetical protein
VTEGSNQTHRTVTSTQPPNSSLRLVPRQSSSKREGHTYTDYPEAAAHADMFECWLEYFDDAKQKVKEDEHAQAL